MSIKTMMRRPIFLIILLTLCHLSFANDEFHCSFSGPNIFADFEKIVCEKSIEQKDIEKIVADLIESDFPTLKEANLEIKYFESDAYYLATWVKPFDLVKKKHKREYILKVNRNLFQCPPPPEALKAILAHELQHIYDYTQMSGGKLLDLLKRIGLSKKKRAEYERATDLSVMKKGYALGIKGYREWIYPKLAPKDLATKKKFYWTPAEIDKWLENNK